MADPKPNDSGQLSYSSGGVSKMIDSIYAAKPPNFKKEATGEANTIYKPVLDEYNRQGKAATREATSDVKDIRSMYSGLQNSIAGEGKNIDQRAMTAMRRQGNITQGTQDAVNNNFNNANENTANLLKSLGIQAAAPDVLSATAEHGALLSSLVAAQGQSANNLTTNLNQNALNFNTAQKNIAGFEGAENVIGRRKLLTKTRDEIRGNRANTKSQMASQSLGLAQQLKGQYTDSLSQRANSLVNLYGQQQQMGIAQLQADATVKAAQVQAGASLAAAQMQAAATQASAAQKAAAAQLSASGKGKLTDYQKWETTPAGAKIYSEAAQTFGKGREREASQAVSDALAVIKSRNGSKNPNFASAAEFADALIRQVGTKNVDKNQNRDLLRSLAVSMWKTLGLSDYQNQSFLNGYTK